MHATLAALERDRLIAIVRAGTAATARACARAAHEAGVHFIEIAFGTPDCATIIEECATWPGTIAGAGTVLSAEEARTAARAGARFSVAPNVDADVIRAAKDAGMLAIPGASTPTEIVAAHRAGADLVKVFPCKTLGGPEYIRLVRGPLPAIPLVATGGIALSTVPAYLEAGVVAVGATNDLFIPDLLDAGDWERVTRRARSWREAASSAPRAEPAPRAESR